MQPFGLFNLLKSTLFNELTNTEQPPKNDVATPTLPPSVKADELTETEQTPSVPPPTDKPNACLDFLNRHEIRAGRQKK